VSAWKAHRVSPGKVVSRRDASASFVQTPTAVGGLLAADGCPYMLATWDALSDLLRHHDREQHNEGGMLPCVIVARLRDALGRSRATVYRHLARLEALGLLDRSAVKGRPQRGPGTRVRFFLRHALWRPWRATSAARPLEDARPTGDALVPAEGAERGPPPADPDGPRSARETLDRLMAGSENR